MNKAGVKICNFFVGQILLFLVFFLKSKNIIWILISLEMATLLLLKFLLFLNNTLLIFMVVMLIFNSLLMFILLVLLLRIFNFKSSNIFLF